MSDAPRVVSEPTLRSAGQWLRAIGYAWIVAAAVLALDVGLAKPEGSAAHGMVPGVAIQLALVWVILWGMLPGVVLAVLGTYLVKGAQLAWLGILCGIGYVWPLATGIAAQIPVNTASLDRFLFSVAGMGLMLVPTALLVRGVAEARGPMRSPPLRWAQERAGLLTVAAPIFLVCAMVVAQGFRAIGRQNDWSPLRLRSDRTLILEATDSPPNADAREELRRRGPSATHEAVAKLASLPPDQDVRFGARPSDLEALMGLVADLGGSEAPAQLRFWLSREDASIPVRSVAALALARLHDRASVPAIVGLLAPPDPGPGDAAGDAGRYRVMEALRIMPAGEASDAIEATLRRQGPEALSARYGIHALKSLGTPESLGAYYGLRTAWIRRSPNLFPTDP